MTGDLCGDGHGASRHGLCAMDRVPIGSPATLLFAAMQEAARHLLRGVTGLAPEFGK